MVTSLLPEVKVKKESWCQKVTENVSGWCSPRSTPQCRLCSEHQLLGFSDEESGALRGCSQDNRAWKMQNQCLKADCWWRSWRAGHRAVETHWVCSNWPPQPWWQWLVCLTVIIPKGFKPHSQLVQRKAGSLGYFFCLFYKYLLYVWKNIFFFFLFSFYLFL